MAGIPTAFALSALGAAAKRKATIGAVRSAAGTAATTLGMAGLNTYLQDRAFRQEKNWWKEQFDYSARYDTPKAQMARMKEAGLNPALMYGGQGSVAGAPSPSYGGYDAPTAELSNLAKISGEAQQAQADLGIKRAQEAYLTQQGLTEAQRGRLTGAQADVAEGLTSTNIQLQKYALDLRKEQLISQQIDNYIKDSTKNQQVQMWALDLQNKMSTIANLDTNTKKQKAETLLLQAKTELEKLGINASIQGALLLAIRKMLGIGGEEEKPQTLEEKIEQAKEEGNTFKANQLKNQLEFKTKQNKKTRKFGERSNYGPKF